MFTKSLIQAVSDWQRGGSPSQKKRRGETLRPLALALPSKFRTVTRQCYRQIGLSGSFLMHMGTHYELTERLSSWSMSEAVAKDFKGGVPSQGSDYQGVIFCTVPSPESVILDLTALFADVNFVSLANELSDEIDGYHDGMGRYWDSQQEAMLDIDRLPISALHAWGGYSSPEAALAEMFFGHTPSADEMKFFRQTIGISGLSPGAYWLSTPEAVARINQKLQLHAARLSKHKEA